MARLSPLLIAVLLCSSCNTFFKKLSTADTSTPDMEHADADAANNANDANNANNISDMETPNDGGDASTDMSSPTDMRDGGQPDMGPYVWDGQPDAPLVLQPLACDVPDAHAALTAPNWLRGEFEDDIDFIPLDASAPSALLGWIDAGAGWTAPVNHGDDQVGALTELVNPTNNLPLTDIVIGPTDTPGTTFSITTTGFCTDQPLGSILDGQTLTLGCPSADERPILLQAMEAAGGFDPFIGVASLGYRAVWQEVVGQPTPKLVASGGGFGREAAISVQWQNPRMIDNFSIGTHGPLAFFPDADGRLFSWDITDADDPNSSGGLPFETDITNVSRGGIDVVKIDARRYVVARVVSNAIELTAYEHANNRNSEFNRVGRWYAITDLHNPGSVELATFQGGFALWYEQSDIPDGHPMGPQGWSVQPFEVSGDELRVFECPYVHRYDPLTTRDNDLLAWRVDTDLVVLGAVNFRYNGTQYINVEGPRFLGLFQ